MTLTEKLDVIIAIAEGKAEFMEMHKYYETAKDLRYQAQIAKEVREDVRFLEVSTVDRAVQGC